MYIYLHTYLSDNAKVPTLVRETYMCIYIYVYMYIYVYVYMYMNK